MRCVVQRVTSATVEVEGKSRSIGVGLCVLVGIAPNDGNKDIQWMLNKLLNLKIFSTSHQASIDGVTRHEEKKWGHSLSEIEGGLLLVSQFTLYHITKGTRLDFHKACEFEKAHQIFSQLIDGCKKTLGDRVQTGFFGEHMKLSLTNDGPVTLVLESPFSTRTDSSSSPGSEPSNI